MNCTACQHDNRPGRRFCVECGAPMALACPGCGAAYEAGEKFCGDCGVALAATPSAASHNANAPRDEPSRPAPAPVSESSARKIVSIIFADLVGSTALHERIDAESAQRLMDRYYEALRAAVENHGGVVVKLLGDGVMAAFGLRQAGEDDALRAVRAAVAMQKAFGALASEQVEALGESGLRVAVNTGEVVVSGDHDDLIGDPVNVAARLQDQGKSGDVVLGEATRRLIATQVTLAPLGTVTLRGRAEAVAAYRVISLDPPAAAAVAPFVGRDEELRRLGMAYEVAVGTPVARLVVLLGSPGLGKSRLVDEFTRRRAEEATIVAGHCDAAGGATFAPLSRALRALLGLADAAGSDAVRAAVESALPADADSTENARIARGIADLISGAPSSPEETFFTVRRFFAGLAATAPVVLVVDDLQWAEPLLLDLLEHLVQWGRNVPLLVVAGARPELRELRSSLVVPGALVTDVVTLGGLDAGAAMRLAANVIGATDLPSAVAAKVLATSEGNPLFVSELVRMLVQEGALTKDGDRWIVGEGLASLEMPPTIHALLAARIERLRPEDRAVLERAAVVGRHFSRSAVAALLPGQTDDLDSRLEALTRGELIERDSGWFLGEPALRFHHLLIRDAAYRRLLKGTRADLHATLADWVESRAGDSGDHDETIGRHLEQAHLLLRELGPVDARTRDLGARAAQRLSAAGRRALARDDLALSANLLGRALECLDAADAARADLALDWCEALLAAGDVGPAAAAISELARFTAESPRLRAWHACFTSQLTVLTAPEELQSAANAVAEAAQVLADLDDAAGEAKAHSVHAAALARLGKIGACEAALDRALAAARRGGDRRRANAVLAGAPVAALWGPSPVTRASGRCLDVVRVLRITQGAPAVEAVALACQAVLEALRGRSQAARRMLATSRKIVEDLGVPQRIFEVDVLVARIELLEENATVAEQLLRGAYDGLRDLGLGIDAARAGALLARALLTQGRAADAETLSYESERLAGDDLQAAIAWRCVRAEALAERGQHGEAAQFAGDAVRIAAATDALLDHAGARLSLAATLRAAGKDEGAAREERLAKELWEAKGATLLGQRGGAAPAGEAVPQNAAPEAPAPVLARRRRPVRANVASAAAARFDRAVNTGDDEALLAVFAETVRGVDHVNGAEYGRPELLDSFRRLMRLRDVNMRSEPIAALGDRLVLCRRRISASGGGKLDVGPFDREEVVIFETDDDGRMVYGDNVSVDYHHEAVVRLYQRYADLLPEGDERVRAQATAQSIETIFTLAATGDEEIASAAISPDVCHIDHRQLGLPESHGAAESERTMRSLFEVADATMRARDTLALGPHGFLNYVVTAGVGHDSGGDFENHSLMLLAFDAFGRLVRGESFDVDKEVEALARYEELLGGEESEHAAPTTTETTLDDPFENAAARASRVLREGLVGKAGQPGKGFEVESFRGSFAPGFRYLDRRKIAHLDLNLDQFTEFVSSYVGLTLTGIPRTLLATRGERLALVRLCFQFSGGDVGPSESAFLNVLEVDEQGAITRMVRFEEDDLDAAYEELADRYESESEANSRPLGDAIARRDWAAVEALCAPSLEVRDRRPFAVLGTVRGGAEWAESLKALVELAPDVQVRLDHVRSGPGGELVVGAWEGTREGGAFEIPLVLVRVMDERGRVAQIDTYDLTQLELARHQIAGAASPVANPFANAATRVGERFEAAWHAKEWDTIQSLFAPDYRASDRRSYAHLEMDREQHLQALRLRFDMEVSRYSTVLLATRGNGLALSRGLFELSGGDVGPSESESLLITEVNRDGKAIAMAHFDADNLEEAYAELEARYEAGEAAHLVQGTRGFTRILLERDWEGMQKVCAPGFVQHDHRSFAILGTTEGAQAWAAGIRALVELAPDITRRIEHARPAARGHLIQLAWQGTHEGGPFEIPMTIVLEQNSAGKWIRNDIYDVERSDLAFQRLAQLNDATEDPFANDATRASERFSAAWAARDWEGVRSSFAPGFQNSDRRSVAHLELDPEQTLQSLRPRFDMDGSCYTSRVVATRGDRLALVLALFEQSGGDVGPSEIESLFVLEVDETGKFVAMASFDAGDWDAAYQELDARFLAGECAGLGRLASWGNEFVAALEARDFEKLRTLQAPDYVGDDQRLAGFGAFDSGQAMLDAIRIMLELAPDARMRGLHARFGARASVGLNMWFGSRDGGEFESVFLHVTEHDGEGRALHQSFFDAQHVDRAMARFREIESRHSSGPPVSSTSLASLTPSAPLVEYPGVSAAARHLQRGQVAINTGDWDGFRALCAPSFHWEDRRRLFQMSGDVELIVSSMRERRATGLETDFRVAAVAGDRVAIHEVMWAGAPDGGRVEIGMLLLTEVDANGQFVAIVNFDAEDRRAAQREAWKRWANLEPALAPMLAMVGEAIDAFNIRDAGRMRALYAQNLVSDDHRRTGTGRIEGPDAYLESVVALWDLAETVQLEMGWHVLEIQPGMALMSIRWFGDVEGGGGPFESEYLMLFATTDGLIDHLEFFESEDHERAKERFEKVAGR